MAITSARRYWLLKAQAAEDIHEDGLMRAWWHKHDNADGEVLPEGFPSKSTLEASRYTALEDIHGATEKELRRRAGLSASQARAVLAALED